MQLRIKTAGSTDIFDFDWAALGELPAGVTILGSAWVGGGLTVSAPSFTTTTTTVKLSGGALDSVYIVTNRVTLSDGQVIPFSILIRVVERLFVRTKDPAATKDFGIQWETSGELAAGETISTSIWAADAGITIVTSGINGLMTTVRLSGGTLGTNYRVKNTITTNAGQTKEAALLIKLQTE